LTTAATPAAAIATLDVGIDQDADRFEPRRGHSRLRVAERFLPRRFAPVRLIGDAIIGIRHCGYGLSSAASAAAAARPASDPIGLVVVLQVVVKRGDIERNIEQIVDFRRFLGHRAVLTSGAAASPSAATSTWATRFVFSGAVRLRFGNQTGSKTAIKVFV
jgi:hypothetical protein